VPTAAGPCALFIDPFGRSLSPVPAAGMHRRERPRMRWRPEGSRRPGDVPRTRGAASCRRGLPSWRCGP